MTFMAGFPGMVDGTSGRCGFGRPCSSGPALRTAAAIAVDRCRQRWCRRPSDRRTPALGVHGLSPMASSTCDGCVPPARAGRTRRGHHAGAFQQRAAPVRRPARATRRHTGVGQTRGGSLAVDVHPGRPAAGRLPAGREGAACGQVAGPASGRRPCGRRPRSRRCRAGSRCRRGAGVPGGRCQQRRHASGPCEHQRAHALGAVQLVRRHRHQVGPAASKVQRDLPASCVASTCSQAPRHAPAWPARHRHHTPVSLLAPITLTSATSSPISALRCFQVERPCASTGSGPPDAPSRQAARQRQQARVLHALDSMR
jgi:hypothetical protein